jgi:Na+/proline symporter
VIILTIAISAFEQNHVSRDEFKQASNWTVDGLMAAVTLVVAIACAELFNQSTWQRVWAAKDVRALRRGFLLGSLFVFLLVSIARIEPFFVHWHHRN